MSVLKNEVLVNDYNFAERKKFGSPVTVTVVNETTRTMKLGETVFAKGVAGNTGAWIGNVTEQDGILAGERGTIDVSPNRQLTMNQVDITDTFAEGKNPIWFTPQTNSDPGFFIDTTAVGSVLFKAEVIGAAPAATPAYIEFKPPYQDGDLILVV